MELAERRARLGALAVALALAGTPAQAHEGLHERIAAATAELDARPNDARLYLLRGELLRAHGEAHAALADLEAASRLAPELAEAHLAVARVFLDQGKLAPAEEACGRFLMLRPGALEGLLLRSEILLRRGLVDEAVRVLDAALSAAQAAPPDAYLKRASVLASLPEPRLEQALAGLDQGIARLGLVPSLVDAAVELECALGRFEAALGRLDALRAQSARGESLLARRGDVLARAGRKDEALAAYCASQAAVCALRAKQRNTRAIQELERRLEREIARLTRMQQPDIASAAESAR